MPFRRSSGVLLHPTSLPGVFGIGDLGPSVFEFIDRLASAGQRLWQVLPLGPTGYGDSPYQCFSAFAGNPLLISLERLIEDGLLTKSEAGDPHVFQPGDVDFPAVIAHRRALWHASARSLRSGGWPPDAQSFRPLLQRPRELVGRLRAVHGHQGRARSDGVGHVGARHRASRSIRGRALVGPLRSRNPAAQIHPVSVLRAVAAGARRLPRAIDPDHGRSANFRRARQRRCLGATRVVSSRFRRPTDRAHRCAARLLQRDRPVMGESPLPVGCPRTDRIRLVDRALSGAADAGRLRPHRSLPRLRSVVGGATRRDDGHTRRVGERTGRVALRSGAIGAGDWIGCPSWPRTSASSHRKWKLCASGSGFPEWRSSSSRLATTRRRPISDRITTHGTVSSTPEHTTTTPPWDGGPAQLATAHGPTPSSRANVITPAVISASTDERCTGSSSAPCWRRSRTRRSFPRRTSSAWAATRV